MERRPNSIYTGVLPINPCSQESEYRGRSQVSQSRRYKHIVRKVCRKHSARTGKKEAYHRGACRTERHSCANALLLGKRNTEPNQRFAGRFGQRLGGSFAIFDSERRITAKYFTHLHNSCIDCYTPAYTLDSCNVLLRITQSTATDGCPCNVT